MSFERRLKARVVQLYLLNFSSLIKNQAQFHMCKKFELVNIVQVNIIQVGTLIERYTYSPNRVTNYGDLDCPECWNICYISGIKITVLMSFCCPLNCIKSALLPNRLWHENHTSRLALV